MPQSREQIVGWERRWAIPVALASFLPVVLLIVSQVTTQVSGDGSAAILRSVHQHSGSAALSGVLQAIAFLLLAGPLYYLFRVVRARSDSVRSQLVGLVLIAPVFLAASSALTIGARNEAADQFVSGEAKSTLSKKEAHEKCVEQRDEEGAKDFAGEFEATHGATPLAACEARKIEDKEASNAIGEATLTPFVSGFGLAGGLGFAIALLYSGLWAMRTGVLTRFWGSLGMASGVAFLLGPLFLVTLIWFVYFGLLAAGWLPGGRPPAWEAGEAVPWPAPGEKAAAELGGEDRPEHSGEDEKDV
ncbi:MAG TPA: hypothetical protein VG518_07190 [Solirubrobacterales bacterium]|nr:hypothetical protein [Solirubrobacterales bacterium]